MKKILTVIFLLLSTLSLIIAALWWQQQQALPSASQILVVTEKVCPAPGSCLATGENKEIHLFLPNKIKVMEEFPLEISLNKPLVSGLADFTMIGMDMGQHRYQLQLVAENQASAQVMLPVCVSQRSDWQLRVQLLLANGEIWQADFPLVLERW